MSSDQRRRRKPNLGRPNDLGDTLALIDRLVAAGAPRPPEIDAAERGFAAIRDVEGRSRAWSSLTDAVLSGDEEAVREAVDRYSMEKLTTRAEAREEMKPIMVRAIRAAWKTVADEAHAGIAARFNKAALGLTKIAAAVDLETPAERMVGRPKAETDAWGLAPAYAAELDELLSLLIDSLRLSGVTDIGTMGELALCADLGSAHRRRVVECWTDKTPHHAGRWGGLVRLGCTLRAAPLDGFAPYPPLATYVRDKAESIDPEDSKEAAARAAEIVTRREAEQQVARMVAQQYGR